MVIKGRLVHRVLQVSLVRLAVRRLVCQGRLVRPHLVVRQVQLVRPVPLLDRLAQLVWRAPLVILATPASQA